MGSIDGKVERKNGSIILINEPTDGELCWNFRDVGRQNGPDQVLTPLAMK